MKDALVPDILGKTPCAGDERESAVTSCIADERVPCIMDIGSAETYLQRFVKSMNDTTWKSLSNEHLSRIWAVSVAVVKSSHENEVRLRVFLEGPAQDLNVLDGVNFDSTMHVDALMRFALNIRCLRLCHVLSPHPQFGFLAYRL
jgi:hypothetical protein